VTRTEGALLAAVQQHRQDVARLLDLLDALPAVARDAGVAALRVGSRDAGTILAAGNERLRDVVNGSIS
jgi:hypothetical protein